MTRLVARLSLAAVAVIAAVASYLHALVVVQAADGRSLVAWFIPLLADLVIASAAANLLDASRTGHDRPGWSVAAIAVGIVVTLGSNVMSGYAAEVPSWMVNAWPPVAFVFGLESIVGMVQRARPRTAPDQPAPFAEPDDPPDLGADFVRLAERHSQRQLADFLGVSHATVNRRLKLARTAQLNGSAPHE
jgi:hypothetical protein